MEFLFDSANLNKIATYMKCFPITGVTGNPTILKAEGKIDFFAHMRAIRQLIGPEKTLHIQVIAADTDGILREAEALRRRVDPAVYVKIPATEAGLAATRRLKAEGTRVTATAIYSKIQGILAILSGADYIAPYYNRMESLGIDPCDVIASLRDAIDEANADSKIIAASFKNIAQVTSALSAGAHAVTVQPALLHDAFQMAPIAKALEDFQKDWVSMQGDVSIDALP